MTSPTHGAFNCSVCNKPVDLQSANADHNGKAVHAECYLTVVVAKGLDTANNPQPAS